jgi:pimeloyl-ACP methyl ester carboxylesterase
MTQATDELIELRGLRFHYRDWPARSAAAPVVVLLHGYTGHARSWDAFAKSMTDRCRLIAFDQRGHGESAWAGPGGYAIDELTADLEAFVGALGLARFDLVGLSMGGLVAIDFAGKRPAALRRLVIVDIAPEIERRGSERIQTGQKQPDVFVSREAAFEAMRASNPIPPAEHLRHRVHFNLMALPDGRYIWRYDRALRDVRELKFRSPEEGWASCAAIGVPTLIVRGEVSDIFAPAVAERMVRTIPGSRLAVVEGSGHSIPLDKPDGFLTAVRDFLTGPDA